MDGYITQLWQSYDKLSQHRRPLCLMKFITLILYTFICTLNRVIQLISQSLCSHDNRTCKSGLQTVISICRCKRKRYYLSRLTRTLSREYCQWKPPSSDFFRDQKRQTAHLFMHHGIIALILCMCKNIVELLSIQYKLNTVSGHNRGPYNTMIMPC